MASSSIAAPICAPVRAGSLAVIDIGSNSIRLVVYDRQPGGVVTLFNEKVLCGLGRGLAKTGKLNVEGVALARANLVRFTRLAHAMGAAQIDLLATAAVRDSEDGPAFKAEMEALCGHSIRVLTGQEEGRLSALGVVAGFPGAHGVMGDLGGGSMELVEIVHGTPQRSVTLPLGPFKLMEAHGTSEPQIAREIAQCLEKVDWLGDLKGADSFFAVGGAWRNLARIDIEQRQYPLRVIHGYAMPKNDVTRMAAVLGRLSKRSLSRIKGVTKARLEVLPTAAVLLDHVVRRLKCKEVRFSAFGLREGHVYDQLSVVEQSRDPLLAACAEIARRDARFDHMGDPLMAWTDPLFPNESPEAVRLRQASCLLSDIAWREHPDYRAQQALYRILHFPFIGLSHAGRAFLGLASYSRYGGRLEGAEFKPYRTLLTAEERSAARTLGLAQRLAYQLSGATREVLAQCALHFDEKGQLRLILPQDGSVPAGEAVERRLMALAESLEAKTVMIGD